MAGGSEELSIIVRMRDFATRQFQTLGGTIGKWAQAGIQKVGQFAKNLLSFHGILGMIGTAWGAMRLVDHIAEVEDIGLAFESLTKKVGGSEAILNVLRTATRGTVSDFKLMETANKAILLGVGDSAEQFEMLATLARRLGRAVGRDTVDAFNDLTMGIGRQSRLILDNLGLIVKVEEANEAYAAALGVTVSSLTEAQKKQSFMNATMEAARVKVGELGEDTWTMSDALGALKAFLGNLGNEILRETLPALTELFNGLRKGLTGNRPAIMNFAADVVEGFAQIAIAAGPAVDSLKSVLEGLMKIPAQAGKAVDAYNKYYDWWSRFWGKAKTEPQEVASAAEKSTKAIGEALFDLSQKIRVAGAEIDEETAKIAEFVGPKRFSYQQIDLGGRRIAALREEVTAYVALSKEMDRVQQIRAKFDFAPPLIEAPKGDVYKYRNMFSWMKEANDEMDRMHELLHANAGAGKAFTELQRRSTEWGKATYEAVMEASSAISYNLVDAVMAIGENFKDAGRLAREFAAQLLKDLARIMLQLTLMQAVQAGMGALGGLFGLGGGEMIPFKFRQHGGYVPRRELAVVGEAGPEIVELPGGSRVHPNSALGGSTVNVVIHNHNPQFRTKEQERKFTRDEQEQIKAVVLQAQNSSVGFRGGMAS
jgi:hypothetical protein